MEGQAPWAAATEARLSPALRAATPSMLALIQEEQERERRRAASSPMARAAPMLENSWGLCRQGCEEEPTLVDIIASEAAARRMEDESERLARELAAQEGDQDALLARAARHGSLSLQLKQNQHNQNQEQHKKNHQLQNQPRRANADNKERAQHPSPAVRQRGRKAR